MKIQPKNIICTTDLSDLSNEVIPFGVALAKKFEAKLYLCHVVDFTPFTMYGEVAIDWEEHRQGVANYAISELKELIGDTQIDCEFLINIGHVSEDIVRIAKEKCADLVISATHGRSGLKKVILGSVAERLMRTLPCPLLSFRNLNGDTVDSEKQDINIRRILVGCDFSPDSNLAFQYALSLAREFNSELHLAHVIEPPIYKHLFKAAVEPGEKMRYDLRDQLKDKLSGMAYEEVFYGSTPKTILLTGSSDEELINYSVLHNIDLIVLGVRGHGLVEKLLVGSTTDRIIRRAPCPVLSVRPVVQVS